MDIPECDPAGLAGQVAGIRGIVDDWIAVEDVVHAPGTGDRLLQAGPRSGELAQRIVKHAQICDEHHQVAGGHAARPWRQELVLVDLPATEAENQRSPRPKIRPIHSLYSENFQCSRYRRVRLLWADC